MFDKPRNFCIRELSGIRESVETKTEKQLAVYNGRFACDRTITNRPGNLLPASAVCKATWLKKRTTSLNLPITDGFR
jgi:hypothetical protein